MKRERSCVNIYDDMTVYEGDVISSTFTLNPTTAVWTDVTSIVPGSTGVNAGETASGSTTTTVIGLFCLLTRYDQ